MYQGHLDYSKYKGLYRGKEDSGRPSGLKSRHHLPETEEEDYYRPDYVGCAYVMPMLIVVFLTIGFLMSGWISYEMTKEVSEDGSHVHWTWFGKYMINEDGKIRSHHFGHPEKCAVCKEIFKEMNDKSTKKSRKVK